MSHKFLPLNGCLHRVIDGDHCHLFSSTQVSLILFLYSSKVFYLGFLEFSLVWHPFCSCEAKSCVSQQIKGLYRLSYLYATTNFYDEPIYGFIFLWLQLKVYAVHFLNSMFIIYIYKTKFVTSIFNC